MLEGIVYQVSPFGGKFTIYILYYSLNVGGNMHLGIDDLGKLTDKYFNHRKKFQLYFTNG
jgi:hypothetical protein